MSFAEDLISILGKKASSAEVARVLNTHTLTDIYDDPPFRRYVGSAAKGVDLPFENGTVFDVQIFVQRSETHSSFPDELPFGVKVGMTDKEIHSLLGDSDVRDSVGSRYKVLEGAAKLTIIYDQSNVVSYMSISPRSSD